MPKEFYAYSWHVDEEYQDGTYVRIYGVDDLNRNVCVSVNGFRPFVWLELPRFVRWTRSKVDSLRVYLKTLFPGIKTSFKMLRKLYGANLRKVDSPDDMYEQDAFPFMLCSFQTWKEARINFVDKLKNNHIVPTIGSVRFKVHGQDACPRLQMTSKYDLPTAGWMTFDGIQVLNEAEKFTFGTEEFMVDLNDKRHFIKRSSNAQIADPLILSFDLEVNSEDGVTMPKASRPGDAVFQISCVFFRLTSGKLEKILLSLGNPKITGVEVRTYTTEKNLLMGYRDLMSEKNPNVIIGYNIFNFDIPYMLERTRHKSIYVEWSQQGFAVDKCGIEREIKWSSSAYKNQNFKYLDCEGRLYIDLLPVVQRDFKLDNYKLKTVSTHFLGETKDDLDPTSIFKCYREGIVNNGPDASEYMSICGKYCIQDSVLVAKLFDKLNVWYGLSEMAVVCNVPMINLFTKGQQIKVYSNLYKYCLHHDIVVEKNGYLVSDNERYVGAYVFAPKPGLYENVVPLDFSALYPSIIIAYNIDYTTCAFDPQIPDDMCHIMEWEDHIGCKHDPKVVEKARLTQLIDQKKKDKDDISDYRRQRSELTKSINKNVMCEKRRYRFLKVSNDQKFKGVLPTIVQSLLDARCSTRKEMSALKTKIAERQGKGKDVKNMQTMLSVLNQRQLAYKISANSMYGITGVKAGMLPFMPVAMSITYMGRKNILKAADYGSRKFGGELIYIDTDSNYFSFPDVKTHQELWDKASNVASEISALFPPPMRLEFEEAIYTKFLILTKKRYMYKSAARDGTVKAEIGKRGVLLNRRDNSLFIRTCYENMVKIIFDDVSDTKRNLQSRVISSIIDDVDNMFAGAFSADHFVITKSTGDYGNLKPCFFQNEKGIERAMIGQYNVPKLTTDVMSEEGIVTPEQESDWYLDKLPAHIQLLEKIKRRGIATVEGCRLEYVILETNRLDDKQCEKIESLDYYVHNKDVLRLDYLYYLSRLVNPVDQVLEVIFGLRDFMKKHHRDRVAKHKVLNVLKYRHEPIFDVEKDQSYLVRSGDNRYKITSSMSGCIVLMTLDYSAGMLAAYSNDMLTYFRKKYGAKSTLKTKLIFHRDDSFELAEGTTEKQMTAAFKREVKRLSMF